MNIEELMQDISATFPVIQRQLREGCLRGESVWMISNFEADMPDGLPVFRDGSDDETYSCAVHTGFDAWLNARGWYLEREDDFWFIPTELPTAEELAEMRAESARIETALQGPRNPFDCPF